MNLGGLSIREVAVRTWERIIEHEILTRAAAITFYAIAALVPFLALVITLTAYCLPRRFGWRRAGRRGPPGRPTRSSPCSPAMRPRSSSREIERLQERPAHRVSSRSAWWRYSGCRRACSSPIMDAMNRIMGVRGVPPVVEAARRSAMLMALSQAAILIVVFATILAWPQILHYLGLDPTTAVLVTAVHGVLVFLVILLSFALAHVLRPRRRSVLGMDHARQPGWAPSCCCWSACCSASTCSTGAITARPTGRWAASCCS